MTSGCAPVGCPDRNQALEQLGERTRPVGVHPAAILRFPTTL
jgi:hypothetical protein